MIVFIGGASSSSTKTVFDKVFTVIISTGSCLARCCSFFLARVRTGLCVNRRLF